MRGNWGKIYLAALIVMISLAVVPATAGAAGSSFQLIGQTSLEAQMMGENSTLQTRPAPNPPGAALLSGIGLKLDQDGESALRLPLNMEMHISVHYNREAATLEPQKHSDSLLMNSSLDYRLLPNLKVGLNAYLYRPEADNLTMTRPFGERIMGVGPTLKYDLGRWSFLLKTQLESGNQNRNADGLQSSVRIWYAF
ncbi:MAG: hypothetical protein M1438_18775 [Deltaproteobacteria bacterium]|nr:hypothetical protein [Deltaproteobacteria bacterium]